MATQRKTFLKDHQAAGLFKDVSGVGIVRYFVIDDAFKIDAIYQSETNHSYDSIAQKAIEYHYHARPGERSFLYVNAPVSLVRAVKQTGKAVCFAGTIIPTFPGADYEIDEQEGICNLLSLNGEGRISFNENLTDLIREFRELPRYLPDRQNLPKSLQSPDDYIPSLAIKALIYSVAYEESQYQRHRSPDVGVFRQTLATYHGSGDPLAKIRRDLKRL